METKSFNTVWHQSVIKRGDREKLHKHKSVVLWFYGLPVYPVLGNLL